MFNTYKIIFILTLFMGTMISISSMSWLGTWMGLEINLLSFIPLLNKKNNPMSSESSIKYFLVQTLASSIFLLSIIMIMMKNNLMNELISNKYLIMILNSSLLTKMGAAPFHFWFPEIIEKINWMNAMILMTWQKVAPMMILSYTMLNNNFIMIIILMSTFIGSVGGLNQTSIRKMLAFSSINHIGWMISSFLWYEMMWYMYIIIYSFITMTLTIIFNKFNIYYLKQMYLFLSKKYLLKYFILMNLLSLGGLPPFLGFLPKWIIIQNLSNNNWMILIFMIMMSLITLFFYLRIMYTTLMIHNNELNFNFIMNKNLKNNFMISFMSFISINGLILYTIIFNFY